MPLISHQTKDMKFLLGVLKSIGYPLLRWVRRYQSTEEISVEDFMRIICAIVNFIAVQVGISTRFPNIYSLNCNRIFPETREECYQCIEELSKHLGFSHTFTKTEIDSALSSYAAKRATFLNWICIWWEQVCCETPPPTPINHPAHLTASPLRRMSLEMSFPQTI